MESEFTEPVNMGVMLKPDGHACITGVCGDTIEIFVRVQGDTILKTCFMTDGCGATVAAASMATRLADGKTIAEAASISQDAILKALGGLPEESEHCALLASNVLKAAVESIGRKGESKS